MEFGVPFIGNGEALKVFEQGNNTIRSRVRMINLDAVGDRMHRGREERSESELGGY